MDDLKTGTPVFTDDFPAEWSDGMNPEERCAPIQPNASEHIGCIFIIEQNNDSKH